MKKPSFVKLIVLFWLLAALPVLVYALTPDQVFKKVKNSIVVVKTLDVHGKVKAQGSGVLLPSGKIATNRHVVKGGVSYLVGRGTQFTPATLYAEDGEKDICLLKAKNIGGQPVQIGSTASLKVGSPVYAVGAPMGLELSLSNGIVSQLRAGPPPLIQTTAAISPGSSGGGLFDGEGRLVGLTTLYLKDGQSLNFALPVEWLAEIKPGRKPAGKSRSRPEWLKRAIALEESKSWQQRLDWGQRWTKSEPEDAMAWNNLGNAYHSLKRYSEAIDAYRQALRIDPEYANAWYNLGIAYDELERYSDAIDAYRQALRIDPELVLAWNNLGLAYANLKRYPESIDAYRQALRIDSEHAAAWNNLGNAYHSLKRYSEAIDAYRQALRIDPELVLAWNNLGIAYGELERYSDAINACRQVLHIDPEDAMAWYNLGVTYALAGNKTAALKAIRELRRLDPASAEKLFNLVVPR